MEEPAGSSAKTSIAEQIALLRGFGLRAGALTKRAPMGGEAERFTLKGRSRAALGESAQRAHPPERGSFREYWPFREHVCRSAVNQKAEVFALRFVWLAKWDSNSEPSG